MGDDVSVSPSLRLAAAPALGALLLSAAPLGVTARQSLLSRCDGGVIGTVVHREVRAFQAPDGGELFFTTVRVRGTDLATGDEETVDVTFSGGFISERRGAHSSTAPPADATRVGRRVLMFHQHVEDIAEGFSGDVLVDGGRGLFSWFESRRGDKIVQGRGRGSAIHRNVRLTDLRSDLRDALPGGRARSGGDR
jgi:hypothetical protein